MPNLNNLFKLINCDVEINSSDTYCAVPIDGYPNYRLAKDVSGYPCLLISTKDSANNNSIRLEHLIINQSVKCKIYHNDKFEEKLFTVIICNSSDDTLQAYFLKICNTLLVDLGSDPSSSKINTALEKLTELFRSLSVTPTKEVQGLWGELFFINLVKNTNDIVLAWHSTNTDKFDFTNDEYRIEIKSSSNSKRIHHIGLEQLSDKNRDVYIASIQVSRTGNGKNVFDIADEIRDKLRNQELINYFDSVLFSTLGNSIDKVHNDRFDYKAAVESIKFFDSSMIPKLEISKIPSEITNIRFMIDLTNVDDLDLNKDDKLNLF